MSCGCGGGEAQIKLELLNINKGDLKSALAQYEWIKESLCADQKKAEKPANQSAIAYRQELLKRKIGGQTLEAHLLSRDTVGLEQPFALLLSVLEFPYDDESIVAALVKWIRCGTYND
jgi:hypothetical protein